jgi:hypothetical protein
MPVPRRALAAAVPALSALAALTVVPTAAATSEGPCTTTIAGENIGPRQVGATSDPISVSMDRPLSVAMEAPRPMNHLKVEIEFAGFGWTVHDRPSTGRSWASEVPIHDYSDYGLGLYKVVGTGTGPAGLNCSGAALVLVEGDTALAPLAKPIGLAGLALALFGFLAALALALRVGESRGSTVFSCILGVISAFGIVILVQQFGALYPTLGLTGAFLAIGGAVGLALGLFGISGRKADARTMSMRS